MKPENKGLAVILAAVTVVVGVGGIYLFTMPRALPTSLPIPLGTAIPGDMAYTWVAHFSVSFAGGRLVGAWTAFDAHFGRSLAVANDTLHSPGPGVCPHIVSAPQEVNGTFDIPLGPGAYTILVESCSSPSEIVITETIQVVPMGLL